MTTNRLSTKIPNNKTLNMDIYEIQIDKIKEGSIYQTFLFDCQCALYMADYSNQNSFNIIKELISMLKPENNNILTNILIFNKSDIDSKEISNNEINEFINRYTSFEHIDLSLNLYLEFLASNVIIGLSQGQSILCPRISHFSSRSNFHFSLREKDEAERA